jgi:hypothetical protein
VGPVEVEREILPTRNSCRFSSNVLHHFCWLSHFPWILAALWDLHALVVIGEIQSRPDLFPLLPIITGAITVTGYSIPKFAS